MSLPESVRIRSFNQFRDFFANQFGLEATSLSPQTRWTEDLHLDSLDLVRATLLLEEEFNVHISDEDAGKQETLGDTWAYIVQRLNEPPL